ncbi:ATP-binding protein [Lentzea tibetensis]|uniref:ATP-binding protein n=1 Tax=Lentzea tibetensis TaxID=2591470 RepID=UPI00164510A6|nr:LuxR C-terminal-related transcriptional regulator [Lentzea tibetensis]
MANAFVGREHELSSLRTALRANRLTSLVGPGGIGKTRLVRELARRSTKDFRIVELAALTDENALLDFVAAALGVREKPGECPLSAIVARAETQSFVLVLDNCEHVVEECGALVERLLRHCRGLRVVVTSREPLSLPGEVVLRLGPLPADVAAKLFTDRAGIDGALTEQDRAAISRICDNVEGLPLAVELAARRARATCVREVADGLADMLHHDLRATIEWSYRLLSPPEKALLREVSLLVNGFTLDAAGAICPVGDVLPTLLRLAAKSLIERTAAPEGSIRFRMPESIRVFAAEQLRRTGGEPAAWTRTLDWLTALTLPLRDDVYVPQSFTLEVDAERDNLLAAVRRMTESGERPDDRVLLTTALARGWQFSGRVTAALRMLEQVLADVPASPNRAVALQSVAWGQDSLGNAAEATGAAAEAVRCARANGQVSLEMRSLNSVGCVLGRSDRYATAEAVYRHAVAIAPPEQPMAAALLQHNHAWMLVSAGEHDRAAELLARCLPVYRHHLAGPDLVHILHTASAVDLALGRYADARELLLETLRIAPSNTNSLPHVTEGLGVLAVHDGQPVLALVHFAAATAYRTRMQRVASSGWCRQIEAAADDARAAVSAKDLQAAERRGRAMSEDALRAFLVAEPESATLTTRELEVVRHLADGDGNQEIARRLGMASRTVSCHLERVKEKLGIHDRSGLQQWYLVEHG